MGDDAKEAALRSAGPSNARGILMAKGERKSNREKRKPKADKKKVAVAAVTPFAASVAQRNAEQGRPGKKAR